MKIIIFGNPDSWPNALELINKYCRNVEIIGFSYIDLGEYAEADVTYTLGETAAMYCDNKIDGVLNMHPENTYFFDVLEQCRIKDIYVIPDIFRKKEEMGEDISNVKILFHYKDFLPELNQLEFHMADHCNLNCKGCTHFSNLVSEPKFADYNQFVKDIGQLAKYFSQIHSFYLLGGEPLLNPEIGEFVKVIRKEFPYTNIIIVTNGILLMTINEQLINILKENRVHISVSDYICLDHQKIISFIQKHELSADLRIEKENFSKHINVNGNSDASEIFSQCFRKNCNFLDKGRIAACCQPFTAHYFNEYFGEHLPECPKEDCIDLYEEDMDGWKIKKRLITPMKSCEYCTYDVSYKWDRTKAPFDKKDWCVEIDSEVKHKD